MASRASEIPTSIARYRHAVPFPQVVKENCRIYLDEGLYINAIALIADLVTPGASHPESLSSTTYAFAPEPYHLEIISTLLVHPEYTTHRTDDDNCIDLASRAITLLRNVLAILGPISAHLDEAFSLIPPNTRRNRRVRDDEYSDSDDDGDEKINGLAANQGRVRACAKDFWHAVGWAFNCSVAHKRRWKYWKVWLDYMLDVLDADWEEREAVDGEERAQGETVVTTGAKKEKKKNENDENERVNSRPNLRRSLLVKYLEDAKGRSAAVARVVGAVFANGGEDDVRAYPEVFPNETKERRFKARKRQKRKRNSQDWIFDCTCGDYGRVDDGAHSIACEKCNVWQHSLCLGFSQAEADDEDFYFVCSNCSSKSVDGEMDMPASSQDMEIEEDDSVLEDVFDPMLGGSETMVLRQRLLVLLSRVAYVLPDCFSNGRELYRHFVDQAKLLPLPAFSLLISASDSTHLNLDVHVTFILFLLRRLLAKEAPDPSKYRLTEGDDITQELLETCILPFSASTSSIADNARVSLLAENALRLLIKSSLDSFDKSAFSTPGLESAVEAGIAAREAKVRSRGRGRVKGNGRGVGHGGKTEVGGRKGSEKGGGDEEVVEGISEMRWLDGSSARLRRLVACVRSIT